MENTLSKSLKQPAAGITAFVTEPLCLLLGAPFHPVGCPVCVHLPCHDPSTSPSAPAAALLRGLNESRVAALRGDGWCCRAAVQVQCSEGEAAAHPRGKPPSTPHRITGRSTPARGIRGPVSSPRPSPLPGTYRGEDQNYCT